MDRAGLEAGDVSGTLRHEADGRWSGYMVLDPAQGPVAFGPTAETAWARAEGSQFLFPWQLRDAGYQCVPVQVERAGRPVLPIRAGRRPRPWSGAAHDRDAANPAAAQCASEGARHDDT